MGLGLTNTITCSLSVETLLYIVRVTTILATINNLDEILNEISFTNVYLKIPKRTYMPLRERNMVGSIPPLGLDPLSLPDM